MIVAKHVDGRVLIMAREHGLSPLLKSVEGVWGIADVHGSELDAFEIVLDKKERKTLLREAWLSVQLAVYRT